ncbi:unnamed protein product [Schistosoma margrebowiei]|uniref:Uncharacterized protein n=1 Tax=Schistosoma margrebowiei TaxID=48269 RepID=A0A183NAU2_9TREM|nr:unnamed protein product [Schistosoma margrebowiei]
METSTSEGKYGIQRTAQSQLDDLNFTDDLAPLSHTHQQMQIRKTSVTKASPTFATDEVHYKYYEMCMNDRNNIIKQYKNNKETSCNQTMIEHSDNTEPHRNRNENVKKIAKELKHQEVPRVDRIQINEKIERKNKLTVCFTLLFFYSPSSRRRRRHFIVISMIEIMLQWKLEYHALTGRLDENEIDEVRKNLDHLKSLLIQVKNQLNSSPNNEDDDDNMIDERFFPNTSTELSLLQTTKKNTVEYAEKIEDSCRNFRHYTTFSVKKSHEYAVRNWLLTYFNHI